MTWALLVVAGYLLGSMPFGYWVVRAFKHVDIRTVGSGNIGATNVWRTYGRAYGIPVVVLDVLKGLAPALVGTLTVSHLAAVLLALAGPAAATRRCAGRVRETLLQALEAARRCSPASGAPPRAARRSL